MTAPFRFPESRHGLGELRYHAGVPVLRVAGSPEEMGEQIAVLGVRPASRLLDYPTDLVRHFVGSRWLARLILWQVRRFSERMLQRFPDGPRREFSGMIQAGIDRDRALAANTLLDMKNLSPWQLFGCSSLIVPEASASATPLFGRNLDFFGFGYLHQYSLVTLYPAGRGRAFVSIGFPGFLGCISGMNEAGLALASHEVLSPPGPTRFNPNGISFPLLYRRVLEECTTTAEAVALVRGVERTTSTMLVLCDREGGAVAEVTPDRIAVRPVTGNVVTCTNHFCSPELASRRPPTQYRTRERLQALAGCAGRSTRFGIEDVRAALHAVHQGTTTLQTMVFEPAALRLHLAIGAGPTTELPLTPLDLEPLLGPAPSVPPIGSTHSSSSREA